MGLSNASKALKTTNRNDFYKQMNFCPAYFESAVKHFYGSNTPYETRYNSWINCYEYFRNNVKGKTTLTPQEMNNACVQLGFYMASWGMYRGSSFLLQNDYHIYENVIPILLKPGYRDLWDIDNIIAELPNITSPLHATVENFVDTYANSICDLIKEIRNALQPYKDYHVKKSWFTRNVTPAPVSKTLVTKLLLGTIGCYPAVDRYFSDAIGAIANDIKPDQIKCVIRLAYIIKKGFLSTPQNIFANCDNVGSLNLTSYPVMKLIDMYYFTFGMEKPFLKLIQMILKASATPNKIVKLLEVSANKKLLKQFIIYDETKNKCIVNISYPCCPITNNSNCQSNTTPYLDICDLLKNQSHSDYVDIIRKITSDEKLCSDISSMSQDASLDDEA